MLFCYYLYTQLCKYNNTMHNCWILDLDGKNTHKKILNHYKNSDLMLSTHNFLKMIKLVIVNLLLEFTGGYMKGWIAMFWSISWRRKKNLCKQ